MWGPVEIVCGLCFVDLLWCISAWTPQQMIRQALLSTLLLRVMCVTFEVFCSRMCLYRSML